jgi:two-component system, NarL family, nitrate/nitrite response regulator NarL
LTSVTNTSTVIVAQSVLLREGLASLLQGTGYKIVASVARPAELSSASCPKGQPTLAIIGTDLHNSDLDQIAASIRLLRSAIPDCKVMLVAEADQPVDVQRVPVLLLDACIFSLCSRDTLIKALELIFMNQRVFVFATSRATTCKKDVDFTDSARGLPSADSLELRHNQNLSPRETQVLASIAEGKSNKLIARACQISEATVKVHLKAILRKTKVHNRTQAAIWAIRHGFGDSSNTVVESNGHGSADSSNNGLAADSNRLAGIDSAAPAAARQTVAETAPSPLRQTAVSPRARYSAGNGENRAR